MKIPSGLNWTWENQILRSKRFLMLVKEHHGTRYFYIPTIEEFGKVCLQLAKDWTEKIGGYTYLVYYKTTLEPPKFTAEDIAKLPQDNMNVKQLKHELECYQKNLHYDELSRLNAEKAKEAILKKDPNLAWDAIRFVTRDEEPKIEFEQFYNK